MAGSDGKWVWFELVTPEVQNGAAFAEYVLEWAQVTVPMPGGEYTMLVRNEKSECGVTSPQQPDMPAHWIGYLQVDDVDARAVAVQAAGGVLAPAFDIPSVGRMCPVCDRQGTEFFLFRGEGEGEGNSTAFHWMELWTSDREDAVDFYRHALGFSEGTMAMPDGSPYSILSLDGNQMGGILTSPDAQVPPAWLPFVVVDDPDAVLDRVQRSGGAVRMPAMDMPGIGRFGIYADREGATLGVIKPAAG